MIHDFIALCTFHEFKDPKKLFCFFNYANVYFLNDFFLQSKALNLLRKRREFKNQKFLKVGFYDFFHI